ncbi:MAG: oxysterol-binding protein, partial [Clostridiales bacterium]|nr:oxysterol-binding protein [Clostridiales bacterium]
MYCVAVKGRNFQFKITASAILCFAIGVAIVLCTQFFYLRGAFTDTVKTEIYEKGEHYSWLIKNQLTRPMSYLGGVVSGLEPWIETGGTGRDRTQLQSQLYHAFSRFDFSEG